MSDLTHRPDAWMEAEVSHCVVDGEPWPCSELEENPFTPEEAGEALIALYEENQRE